MDAERIEAEVFAEVGRIYMAANTPAPHVIPGLSPETRALIAVISRCPCAFTLHTDTGPVQYDKEESGDKSGE